MLQCKGLGILVVILLTLLPAPVFAQSSAIIRSQTMQLGFLGYWDDVVLTYFFSADGSLNVKDSRGSTFYFPPPKFQPNVPYTVSINESESLVTQYFFVNGTDKHGAVQTLRLWVDYDFSRFQLGAKITLRGYTTDPDSEIEYEFENPKGVNIAETARSYQVGGLIYDWSDLEGATTFTFAVNKLKIKFDSAFNLDPSILATVSSLQVQPNSNIVYVGGYWFVFYCNGTYQGYRSSADGSSWSSWRAICPGAAGSWFDFFLEGTTIYYSRTHTVGLYYRKGTVDIEHIDWVTSEQTIFAAGASYPQIAVDTNGYAFVSYHLDSDYDLYVLRNSAIDGTWANATAPEKLYTGTNMFTAPLFQLSSANMYIVYAHDTSVLRGRLWNSTAWESEVQISTTAMALSSLAATENEDVIDLAFVVSGYATGAKYLQRSDAGIWSSEESLGDSNSRYVALTHSTQGVYLTIRKTALNGYIDIYKKNSTWTHYVGLNAGAGSYLNAIEAENSAKEMAICYVTSNNLCFQKYSTNPPVIDEPEIPSGLDTSRKEVTEGEAIDEEKPSILPGLGIWGLLGAVGLIAVGGLMTVSGSEPKRHKSKSNYRPSQPQKSYYHQAPKPQPFRRARR